MCLKKKVGEGIFHCVEEPLIWKTSGETEASLNMVSASHTIATDAAVFVNAQRLQ
jgi:hypothetical protein